MIQEAFEFSSHLHSKTLQLSSSRRPHMPAQWACYARIAGNQYRPFPSSCEFAAPSPLSEKRDESRKGAN